MDRREMVISTHLPPPVMMDRTADLALQTHMLCCSCAICFSAAASSENVQGNMNLASNTAPAGSTSPSSVAAIHLFTGMLNPPLTSLTVLPVLSLVPPPVKLFCHVAELNDQVVGQVLGSTSPRFSRQSRSKLSSSSPMMIRASDPPMNERRSPSFDLPTISAVLPP